jgi:hypothetical protein
MVFSWALGRNFTFRVLSKGKVDFPHSYEPDISALGLVNFSVLENVRYKRGKGARNFRKINSYTDKNLSNSLVYCLFPNLFSS